MLLGIQGFLTVLSVVRPPEAYIWEILGLYLIFYFYVLLHYGAYHRRKRVTAQKVRVLQRTRKAYVNWCIYCTLKHLPLGARPTELGVVSHSAAEPLSCFIRRRFLICAPPPSPRAKPVPPEPLCPQGVTSHPLSTCRRLLSFPNS